MSGFKVFGAVVAIPAIVNQISHFISSTKKTIQDLRNAVGKYEELTLDLVTLSKVIDFADKTMNSVAKEMAKETAKNEAASTLGELNFEPLVQQMEQDIQAAQQKLENLELASWKDRRTFVTRDNIISLSLILTK
ncbi:hypothetical protein F53441_12777, partial [Fusarium austroafricanum]